MIRLFDISTYPLSAIALPRRLYRSLAAVEAEVAMDRALVEPVVVADPVPELMDCAFGLW